MKYPKRWSGRITAESVWTSSQTPGIVSVRMRVDRPGTPDNDRVIEADITPTEARALANALVAMALSAEGGANKGAA